MYSKETVESIEQIAKDFKEKKIVFLNESDLESSLSNSIRSKFSTNISVNTQTPWYDENVANCNYIIDITAFDKNKLYLSYNSDLNRKGYKYDDEALSIELKYFRYVSDIAEISRDFEKMSLLVKAPKNECFIVAGARNSEIFEFAKTFMKNQFEHYKDDYQKNVKIYLFGPDDLIEFT